MTTPTSKVPLTQGKIDVEVGVSGLKQSSLAGGHQFPIRHAKVTRVDAKDMVVDLLALAGPAVPMKKIPITFAHAGNRHFLGAIPEVGDICLVGSAPAESGRSKRFVILGWFVPSTEAGYDWLSVRSHGPEELGLTPKDQVYLKGVASQRRHKLRQIEKGNIVASSSQGADLLLTESATLTNRRGNEVILRDQDQALVVRSLQQFHAGAGFRTYSGMIQRDTNLLPTQLGRARQDFASDRQVDAEGNPLSSGGLDARTGAGFLQNSPIFDSDFLAATSVDPPNVLSRGLFLDTGGNIVVGGNSATYGGKPMYRVCTDLKSNGATADGVGIFTEYRVEVAHTTDGTLPVTEQTDGLDVDRLLKSPPAVTPDTDGGPGNPADPANRSPNAPMVEFVLGTAVGNDAFTDPESYGIPLVAKVGNPNGSPGTTIRAYDSATDSLGDQLAFLVRSRDPTDPTRESFIALSKSGAWLTNFQGEGSAVVQENLRTGKRSFLGKDKDGASQTVQAAGTISLSAAGGRSADNVGVEITSEGGAVSIYGGGSNTAGAANGSTNPNDPANRKTALSLISAKSTLLEAADNVVVKGSNISNTAGVIDLKSSAAVNINSGDSVSTSTKTLGVTVAGLAEYTYGGPKDGLPTNGGSRTTSFSANPATGSAGGATDSYSMLFGGRKETFTMGKHDTLMKVGSFNVRTMNALPAGMMSPGVGTLLSTGVIGVDNKVETGLAGASVTSNIGTAKLSATKGTATVSGIAGAAIKSLAKVGITAPYVSVTAPGPPGGVLTDGCFDSLTGRPFLSSGSVGCPSFRVG
jgi:hypothetical protein